MTPVSVKAVNSINSLLLPSSRAGCREVQRRPAWASWPPVTGIVWRSPAASCCRAGPDWCELAAPAPGTARTSPSCKTNVVYTNAYAPSLTTTNT